jgi:hypothetical protein
MHTLQTRRVTDARMAARFGGRRRAPLSAAARARTAIARLGVAPGTQVGAGGGLGTSADKLTSLVVGRATDVGTASHDGPGERSALLLLLVVLLGC